MSDSLLLLGRDHLPYMVTKQFLEEHPEESPLQLRGGVAGNESISTFLNWPISRVRFSLERLKMIEEDRIDREAIDSLPTERAARNFITSVKEFDIPKERQK